MLGAALTALVAIAGYKTSALTRSGAVAGFIAGTIAIAAGWSWGVLLLAFFVSASILSRIGERKKTALLGPVVEKGGERDAWQVAANGSVFVAAAASYIVLGGDHWYAIAIGALAASTADTWSTEIGTSRGRAPRLIISGRTVPPGTSGGLTAAGTLGAFAGAIFAAVGARIAEWPVPAAAVIAGGVAGALGDSLLGATIQSKRWCEQCRSSTEREIHSCGTPTKHSGGLKWLNNDGVNFISTIIGGLVALAVA
jgi:uncharacterized protein (TIGR00297 family)